MAITLRSTKGSELTFAELDGNFTDLDNRTKVAWAMEGIEPTVREAGNPPEFKTFRDGLFAYAYAPNATNEAYANWDVPFDWKAGTDLRAAVHWSPGNSTNSGTVVWAFEFTWAAIDASFGASTTQTVQGTADGTAYKHFVNVSAPFPGSLASHNMRFLIRIFRDGTSVNDTFPDDAFIVGLDFYYQTEKFGQQSYEPPYT